LIFFDIEKIKKPVNQFRFTGLMLFDIEKVGKTGFEPATPWSQTTYSTGLNYLPKHVFLLKPEKHNFLFYQGGKSKHSALSLQIKGGIATNNLLKPVNLWYHSEFFAGCAQTDGICTRAG
jgi:hypothetical protein